MIKAIVAASIVVVMALFCYVDHPWGGDPTTPLHANAWQEDELPPDNTLH